MALVKQIIADLRWYARHYGLVRAARRVARLCLDGVARRLYRRSVMIVHCADLSSWPDFTPQSPLSIRVACPADLNRLAEDLPPSTITAFRRRMAQGQLMFLAEVEGTPAGFAWMCTGPGAAPVVAHGLRLRPGEGLHWGSETFEQFQRRGIYTSLQRCSRAYMKAQGFVRVYGGAETHIPAPMRMMKSLNLKPVHLRHLRRVCGFTRIWVEPIPPGFTP